VESLTPIARVSRLPSLSRPLSNPPTLLMCLSSPSSSFSSFLPLGVADGVGGWGEVGVDPSEFSWTLMNNAEEEAKTGNDFPKGILIKAHNRILTEKKVELGLSFLFFSFFFSI